MIVGIVITITCIWNMYDKMWICSSGILYHVSLRHAVNIYIRRIPTVQFLPCDTILYRASLSLSLSLSILLVRGDHCVWDCTCTSKVQSNTNQSNASHVHNISISYSSIGDRSDKHGSTNDLDTYSDLGENDKSI